MLKANLSFVSNSPTSTLTAHTAIISKQIAQLQQKKHQITQALQSNNNHSSQIQQNQRQIAQLRHISTTLHLDISKIMQNFDHFEEKAKTIEQEKLNLLMQIEQKEVELDYLRRNLAQHYKSTPSKLDSIRLKMIELENQPYLKSLEPCFSLRKSIITFLKDKQLIKSQYIFGAQLEISRNKLSQQFKWFTIGLLKSCKSNEQKITLGFINEYVLLLQAAEQQLKDIKIINKQNMRFANLQQTLQQINDKQQELCDLQLKMRKVYKRSNEAKQRMEELQSMKTQKEQNNREILLKIQMLKENNHCLEQIKSNSKELQQNLLEVNQAIAYFSSKNFKSSTLNLSVGERSTKQCVISPTSCTSLPVFSSSIVKSQYPASPKTRCSQKRSSKLLLSPKYRKMRSPVTWK